MVLKRIVITEDYDGLFPIIAEIMTDSVIFRYYLSPTYDFIQEILSHGCDVEVLAPKHVRDKVKRHAATIVSRG